MVAHLRVDVIGEVEHRGALCQFVQVTLRGKHIHLVFIQTAAELVHHLHVVARLQSLAYVGEPCVETALALHSLVAPVCGESVFCHLVHAFGAYLHLHPFVLRTQHRDVQTLISVALRH